MKYRAIVADPPWSYDEGWPAVSTSPNSAFSAGNREAGSRYPLPYASLSVTEIAELPVGALAADDAHLFLWTTNRYVVQAYSIAEAWGFRPSCLLTWCKSLRGIGPGGLFASTSEFIVYARRGRPSHRERVPSSWFEWPRGAHSRKPEAFLDLVESVSPGPYLELFARRQRLGWDTWGNEALEHVDMSLTRKGRTS